MGYWKEKRTEIKNKRNCERKVRFRNEQSASNALKDMKKKDRFTGYLEKYCCDNCEGWHIGNNTSAVDRVLQQIREERNSSVRR